MITFMCNLLCIVVLPITVTGTRCQYHYSYRGPRRPRPGSRARARLPSPGFPPAKPPPRVGKRATVTPFRFRLPAHLHLIRPLLHLLTSYFSCVIWESASAVALWGSSDWGMPRCGEPRRPTKRGGVRFGPVELACREGRGKGYERTNA